MDVNNTKFEEKIEESIKNKEYDKSFKALVALIQTVNIKIVSNKLNKKLVTNNFYEIMEIYRKNNFELYEILKGINYIYENYSKRKKVDLEEIIELKELYYKLKNFLNT